VVVSHYKPPLSPFTIFKIVETSDFNFPPQISKARMIKLDSLVKLSQVLVNYDLFKINNHRVYFAHVFDLLIDLSPRKVFEKTG
jgi:hypothetical protein